MSTSTAAVAELDAYDVGAHVLDRGRLVEIRAVKHSAGKTTLRVLNGRTHHNLLLDPTSTINLWETDQ